MRRRLMTWVLAFLVAPLLTASAALAESRRETPPPRPVSQLSLATSTGASTARLASDESGEESEEQEGGSVVVVPGWYPGWYGSGWYGWWGPGWWDTSWYAPWEARHLAVRPSKDAAAVELHVHPWKAEVKVDGTLVGQARDFDSRATPLWVKPGEHVLELSYPGYETLRTQIDASSALTLDLRFHLDKGHGLDPRSVPQES
jgi:hypothetical protein